MIIVIYLCLVLGVLFIIAVLAMLLGILVDIWIHK